MASVSASQLSGQTTKSIQRGISVFSAPNVTVNIPINSINTQRTQVRLLGTRRTDSVDRYISQNVALENSPLYLSSASTITFINDSGCNSGVFSWEIVEYY